MLANKNVHNQKWINDLEDTEQIQTLGDSTFSELVQEEQNINHNYPDERKNPDTHVYRRNEKNFVRGGTDEDKQRFKEENKNLFYS